MYMYFDHCIPKAAYVYKQNYSVPPYACIPYILQCCAQSDLSGAWLLKLSLSHYCNQTAFGIAFPTFYSVTVSGCQNSLSGGKRRFEWWLRPTTPNQGARGQNHDTGCRDFSVAPVVKKENLSSLIFMILVIKLKLKHVLYSLVCTFVLTITLEDYPVQLNFYCLG